MDKKLFEPPERNFDYQAKDVFSYGNNYNSVEEINKDFQRKVSSETSSIKNQYLYIEEELMRSFQYVHPIKENLNTSSVRFATIIRESANLYEIISKTTYRKIYKINGTKTLNILDYLFLDIILNFRDEKLDSPMLYGEFKDTDIFQPFQSLMPWDRNSKIKYTYIPKWWTSYNKVKHDIDGLKDYATLENALLSVGALYLLIGRIYGEGVVGGILNKPKENGNTIQLLVPVSKLFIENTVLIARFA